MTVKSRREKIKDELREVVTKLRKIREEGRNSKVPNTVDAVIERNEEESSTIIDKAAQPTSNSSSSTVQEEVTHY